MNRQASLRPPRDTRYSVNSGRAALLQAAAGLLMGLSVACSTVAPPPESVKAVSPEPFDLNHPPSLVETRFLVDDSPMNAIVYEASGPGPHPTVVLLHGFPGNERNLDLGHAIRRHGWNVVFFHYRGAWGSGGQFSFLHVLEDVAAVVQQVRAPAFASEHRIDPDRIAFVGHSMGGFAALISGAELAEAQCVVSIAGANLGGLASGGDNPEAAAGFAALLDSWAGPIQSAGGEALVEELFAHASRFDTLSHAPTLAKKPLLLLAGGRDKVTPPEQHHAPLAAALRAAGSTHSEKVLPNADHAFSGHRLELTRLVTQWLNEQCLEPAQP